MSTPLGTYFSRRMLLLLAMAFSSGLPLALTGSTLQAWMTLEKVDLKVIGIFSLVGWPYTVKYLWAPIMDRYSISRLGRRRGWLLATQLALLLLIGAMGSSQPASAPLMVATIAVLIAFCSASQDIVIDAYRADLLAKEELAAGAAIAILGYRLGMLTSGAMALILADTLSWGIIYLIMAGAMVVGMVATMFAPEPVESAEFKAPAKLVDAVVQPLLEYFKRPGALEILAFIIFYKLGDVMAVALNTTFLLQLGFSTKEVGTVSKVFGLIASILGSIIGGAFVPKLGMKRALIMFGVIQAVAILCFAVLAESGKNMNLMILAVGAENFTSGLGNAAFIAFLMGLCNKRYTATQYALLSSLAAISRILAGVPTGFFVDAYGWTSWYVFCTVAAVPALFLVWFRFEAWNKAESPASPTN